MKHSILLALLALSLTGCAAMRNVRSQITMQSVPPPTITFDSHAKPHTHYDWGKCKNDCKQRFWFWPLSWF
jgi:hypothetical protein